jgi:hypothetical protein
MVTMLKSLFIYLSAVICPLTPILTKPTNKAMHGFDLLQTKVYREQA